MSHCSEFVIVFSTASNQEEAEKIAAALLEKRVAACVSISAPQQSWYYWQGRVHRDEELTLMIKTRSRLFPEVEKTIRQNHSYEVPEIIAVQMSAAGKEYLDWLNEVAK